ncbi:MAG: cob(I)yrinic acid a,c-diamide adenosyltransferase, partial [Microvirga sp.]
EAAWAKALELLADPTISLVVLDELNIALRYDYLDLDAVVSALKAFGDRIEWHTLGEGFTWETQDKARDIAAAEHAWAKALELMADPTIRLVVLDELNIALRYDYLDLDAVVAAFRGRRPDLHVIVTGRNAKPALIEAADLVTEMGSVKHHFAAGVKAQAGIEF